MFKGPIPPGPMMRAVGYALKDWPKDQHKDDALVALSRLYARLIDNAAPSAVYERYLEIMRRALDSLHEQGVTLPSEWSEIEKTFKAIETALSAHSTVSDFGPKLLAALKELGLTPAARGIKGVSTGGADVVKSTVDELRAQRAKRTQRAGTDGA